MSIDATRSLSYSHDRPIDPRDTFTAVMFYGTLFDKGEMLLSFYGNAKRPDDKKSRRGINTNFGCYSESWNFDFMNLPTNGKSTH